MCNYPWTLPSVSKIDQKMNGDRFFRSEYAAGDTGSDPHLTPEAEVKPHMHQECEWGFLLPENGSIE